MGAPRMWLSVAFTLVLAGFAIAQQSRRAEDTARVELDALYKGDYRAAFVERKPRLFLKHIPDDFQSESIEGQKFDAKALRHFFPTQFANMVRTIEHNVTIEDIDIADSQVIAVVTLHTLIEFKGLGGRNYLVNTIGTYRDYWEKRSGQWFEVRGDQLHNQTTTWRRP